MGEEAATLEVSALVSPHLGPPRAAHTLQLHHVAQEPRLPWTLIPKVSPAFHMALTVGAGHFQPQGPHDGWWLNIRARYTHDGSHAEVAMAVVAGSGDTPEPPSCFCMVVC